MVIKAKETITSLTYLKGLTMSKLITNEKCLSINPLTEMTKSLIEHNTSNGDILRSYMKEFADKIKLSSKISLEMPYHIVNQILYGSKDEPWYALVEGQKNYIDWLFAHSINVTIISIIIAEDLRCDEDSFWKIGLGAFLHDIGKLFIPRSIIQRPRKLNDLEMFYIRQHCVEGMNTLLPYQLPKECIDIAFQHHERLDGSGYPIGLTNEEISREAKIVMIADVLDAITSVRPYKQPRDIDDALIILKSESAKYDQSIVNSLERCF